MGAPPPLIHWSSRRSHSRHRLGAPARAQQRAATSDEVLLTRLAVRIAEHRHHAAVGVCVALASSGATQAEVPAVLTGHLAEHRRAVRLPGRHVHNPDSAHYLPPRWVDLDTWSANRIDAALALLPEGRGTSVAYRGTRPVTTQAARTWCEKAVDSAYAAAGLNRVWGLSIGSLSLWKLVHLTHHGGPEAAAAAFGAQAPRTIDRLIRQMPDTSIEPTP